MHQQTPDETSRAALEVIDKIDEIEAILGAANVAEVQFSFKKVGDLSFERTSQGYEVNFVAWAKGGSRNHRTTQITIDSVSGRATTTGNSKCAFDLYDFIELAQAAAPSQIRYSGDYLAECSFPES